MTVTFTLTSGSSGTAAGPFNISGTTSGGALNGVLIATGVLKTELVAGKEIGSISETITGGTIASTGTCTTTTPWTVITATPTPTPTATPVTSYEYQLGPSYTQANTNLACTNIGIDILTPVYAASSVASNVVQFFDDTNLTSPYAGEAEFHAFYRTGGVATYTGRVSVSGFVTDRTVCP